jgi:hypothetical protein
MLSYAGNSYSLIFSGFITAMGGSRSGFDDVSSVLGLYPALTPSAFG